MPGKSMLFQKLAKITGEISRVPKRGRNEFHKYDYVTEADLLDAVREKLAAQGVAYFFSVTGVSTREAKSGPITEVTVEATFADGESGEVFTVKGAGAGQDSGDKGLYKALTGAQKYIVMKTFMVPTGDDPEIDDEKSAAPAKPASGGKSAGKGKRAVEVVDATSIDDMKAKLAEGKMVMIESKPSVPVQGGDTVIPSGKLKGRTVDSLNADEAEDLLGKLPKGNRWHSLVGAKLAALKAAASDPSLAAAAEAFGAEAVK